MVFPAPPAPAFLPDHVTTTERYPRYEDCTQDGRLTVVAIPPALATLWQTVIARHPGARNARSTGVIALLTRLTVTSFDQPIRVHHPIEATVGFELAHDRDAAGAVSRLFMNVWAGVRGTPGRGERGGHGEPGGHGTHGEPGGHGTQSGPGAHGGPGAPGPTRRAPVLAGQAFAEHTFTRPFAPADQRRVVSLAGIAGYPELPDVRYAAPAPASAAEAPEGAVWLDELAADTVETRFTLDQTDANQHVNSLVYVRCFLDAFQRRLAAGAHPARLRSKAFDIAYRKPSFVGERIRAHLRLFAHGEHIGGAGILAAPGEEARPRCYVRVLFGP